MFYPVNGKCQVYVVYTLSVIMLSLHCFGKTSPLITNVDHRNITDLNGQWKIIIDPMETGFYNYRYKEDKNGYFKAAKPISKSDLVEYSFEDSISLTVPGDWNTQLEKLFFYEGTVWYQKLFDYDLSESNRLFVYFGAANYEAIVYLNGKKIGTHTGGYTPFCFEITDQTRLKDNVLVVKVDNTRMQDAIPTVSSDWWNYGGLTRRVLLIEEPQTFIRDYSLQLKKGDLKTISGWIQLDGPEKQQNITIQIPEADVSMKLKTDEQGYAAVEFEKDLKLWSPQQPKLYEVTLSGQTDTIRDRIGFRTIEVRGTDILLNGNPIFLRGICIHEESPLRPGRAYSKKDAEELFRWVDELNCNFVRLAHYPHNEYMTRLADEKGFLVWSEIPLYWTISWDNPEVYQNAAQQLNEMIARDKNKASVILWSVANETPPSEARTDFIRNLIEAARKQDPTRLITAALQRDSKSKDIQINDPLGQYLDVLGCNEYLGWYGGEYPQDFNKTWQSKYKKPLIMSEFGGGALQGYRDEPDVRWTEDFQARVYERQIEMLKEISFLRGTSPWILKDFRSPRRPLPGIQDYFNRKGLVSDKGVKKKAFNILKEFYDQIENKQIVRSTD